MMSSLWNKTFAWWLESIGGYVLALLVVYFVAKQNPTLANWKEFIKEFPTLGMCAFGFLLTFLGIILSGGTEAITRMKNRKTLFNPFVRFNKRVALLALVLSLYSYALAFFNFGCLSDAGLAPDRIDFLTNWLVLIFVFGLVALIVDTAYFIILFYMLIESD